MPDIWYKFDMNHELLVDACRNAWTDNVAFSYRDVLDSIIRGEPLSVAHVTKLLAQGPVWIKHRKTGEVNHIWKIGKGAYGTDVYYLDELEPAPVLYVQDYYTLMENHD